MRRLVRLAAVLACMVSIAFVPAACGRGGGGQPVVRLDGSPRVPDDEGVATALSHTSITLDGARTYPVSERLVSFSTYTGAIEPMITRKGQYVQIGLDEEDGKKVMVWMAGVAQVLATAQPAVYYTGTYVRTIEGGKRAVFRDGTVIRLSPDVTVRGKSGTGVIVRIDPATHEAVEVTRGGGPSSPQSPSPTQSP
jgi:hypothetical protein